MSMSATPLRRSVPETGAAGRPGHYRLYL